jgi:hypothetical protein
MYAFANGRLYIEHRKILTLVINLFLNVDQVQQGKENCRLARRRMF